MRPIGTIMRDITKAKLVCDPLGTLAIISYECGMMTKTAFYSLIRPPAERLAQELFMKTEMADLVIQLRILARHHNIDFDEVITLGEERVYDCIDKCAVTKLEPAVGLWDSIKGYQPYMGHSGISGGFDSIAPWTATPLTGKRREGD